MDENRPKIVKNRPEHNDSLSLSLYEIYERRRQYPRAIVNIPVKIRTEAGIKSEANLYDISPDGVQIRCNRKTATIICPEGKISKENMQRHLEVIFVLPYRRKQKAICVRVIPIYLLFIEKDLVAFGMQFHKGDKDTLKNIKDYLDYELALDIEELEEILKEKIGKMLPGNAPLPRQVPSDRVEKGKGKDRSVQGKSELDSARIGKDIQEIRRYADILQKVLNKLTSELHDIEKQLNIK